MVTVTDYNGQMVLIPTGDLMVSEQPEGQTLLTFLSNGTTLQVRETVEEVKALLAKEEKPK
jgi:hypothetical protein